MSTFVYGEMAREMKDYSSLFPKLQTHALNAQENNHRLVFYLPVEEHMHVTCALRLHKIKDQRVVRFLTDEFVTTFIPLNQMSNVETDIVETWNGSKWKTHDSTSIEDVHIEQVAPPKDMNNPNLVPLDFTLLDQYSFEKATKEMIMAAIEDDDDGLCYSYHSSKKHTSVSLNRNNNFQDVDEQCNFGEPLILTSRGQLRFVHLPFSQSNDSDSPCIMRLEQRRRQPRRKCKKV